MSRWKRRALWLAWTCLACQSAREPTQTIVVVEADETVKPLVKRLHVRAYSETDKVSYFDAPDIRPHSPMKLPIVPRGDANRWVRLSVDAYGAGDVLLAGAQARISFVANEKRYHHIWLSAACLARPPCEDEDATCVAGECVSARVPIDKLEATDCSLRGCREPPPAEPMGRAGAPAAAPPCADGKLMCGGLCVNPQQDRPHCGACDHDCDRLPNVRGPTRCDKGRCDFARDACVPGHANCNGDPDDGCEQELSMPEHCGACGNACDPGLSCEAGKCKRLCAPGELACGDECVDGSRDGQNCGACGAACSPEQVCAVPRPMPDGASCGEGATCQAGHCTCGLDDGIEERFHECGGPNKCKPGHACVDRGDNGAFYCMPLCETDADCEALADWDGRCSAARCSKGKNTGIRVCNEAEGYLHPMYDGAACCGGPRAADAADAAGAVAMGCADATREAFTDLTKFRDIAGCEAKWPITSMRAGRTGVACGNSLGNECNVPADACAPGWHACATPPYGPTDISDKATAEQCSAQPGMFASAVSDRKCDSCGAGGSGYGAACCGMLCHQQHGDCVYPGATAWFNNGLLTPIAFCAAIEAVYANQGVLCCRGL